MIRELKGYDKRVKTDFFFEQTKPTNSTFYLADSSSKQTLLLIFKIQRLPSASLKRNFTPRQLSSVSTSLTPSFLMIKNVFVLEVGVASHVGWSVTTPGRVKTAEYGLDRQKAWSSSAFQTFQFSFMHECEGNDDSPRLAKISLSYH